MNRKDLQGLSKLRIKEAKLLLENELYDGAYYLCGYSVECALKACITKNVNRFDFPDKKAVVESHSHEIIKLVKIAGLELKLKESIKTNSDFELNWTIVKDWTEISRYRRNSRLDAVDLFNAIVGPKYGVMRWIRKHW